MSKKDKINFYGNKKTGPTPKNITIIKSKRIKNDYLKDMGNPTMFDGMGEVEDE